MPLIRCYTGITSLNPIRLLHSIKQLFKAIGQGWPVVVCLEERLTVTSALMKVYDAGRLLRTQSTLANDYGQL